MANLRKSGNISVFKIAACLLLYSLIRKPLIIVFTLIYLIQDSVKDTVIYLTCCLLIILNLNYHTDFMPYGIIDYSQNNYLIVDKLFYKVRIPCNDKYHYGDILFFNNNEAVKNSDSQLRKNILYTCEDTRKITSFYPRRFIEERISSFDEKTAKALKQIFYNVSSYDDETFNLGYGLTSYYFLVYLQRKNKKAGIAGLLIYSVLFATDIKFILIICNLLAEKLKLPKADALGIKIIIMVLINPELIYNMSLVLPLMFSFYAICDCGISFNTYLYLIESFFFGEVNLFGLLLFKRLMKIRVGMLVLSMIVLFIPAANKIYQIFLNLFSFLNDINIPIRGSFSLLSLLIFIIIHQLNRFRFLDLGICIMLCMLPINNPFMHVSIIDVGQGDAILISQGLYCHNVLIDTGPAFSYYKLKKALLKEGIYTLDYLIITHDDADHNGSLQQLQKDFKIKEIIFEGYSFNLGKLYFEYYDLGRYDNDNDNSLVYRLDIDGYSFLFTGDISSVPEAQLIRTYGPLHIDFLKASHHGSSSGNSRYFVASLLPEFALISTSGRYDHPHESVMETFIEYKVQTLITKDLGTISVCFSGLVDLIKTASGEFVIIKK